MKIKKILSQNRRDFRAIYECEHCGNIEKDDYRPLTTKYPEGMQV